MDKEKFGTFIKNSRIKKNYTQKQLADKLFIDVTAVSKWERGISYPDITLVPEICKVLDLNEHELIQSSNDTEYRKKMHEADKFIKLKNVTFYTLSIMYLVAILTCFIVNISVNHTLSWFWIVFASCLTAFTFFPTCTRFVSKYKFLVFLLTTLISMFILFLTCSIYTNNYWFLIAFTGTLLGYIVVFYPIVFSRLKMYLLEEKYNRIKKYFMLTYWFFLLLTTVILLLVINMYTKIPNLGGAIIITISAYSLLLTYGIVELFKTNRFIKIGIDILTTGLELMGLVWIISKVVGDYNTTNYKVNFSDWTNYISGNINIITLVTILLLGIIFIIIGINKRKNK